MNRTLLLCFLVFCFSSACADEPSKNEEKNSSPAVRESVLAGTWYSASKSKLQGDIDRYLSNIPEEKQDAYPVRALIAPHAGYRWSGQTAAYAYKTLQGQTHERVIVLAPTHRHSFQGGSIASVDAYETPLGRVRLDRKSCDSLLKNDNFHSIAAAHAAEHSLEIQLPFLQRVIGDFELVPIVVGQISPNQAKAMAERIRPLLNKKTLLVMSSDFTHQGPRFGYRPFKEDIRKNVQRLDFIAMNHILNLNVREFWGFCDAVQSTICGRNPIKIGMLALP
ncbi:AmmeMemoRadiSam system protein B, partial [bacterium]|nr:AmmeMemoRadiSam system protein B [bacterium]